MCKFTFPQFETLAKNLLPTTKKSFLKNLSAIPKIGILFIFLAVVPFSVVGQTYCMGDPIPFDPLFPNDETLTQQDLRTNPEYERGACPANDIQILGARIETADACNSCTPGDVVIGDLYITVHHNTNSGDRHLGVFGNITETPVVGSSTMCDVARCSGPLLKSSEETDVHPVTGTSQELFYGQIEFTCGSALELSDILLVWTAANGECPIYPGNNPNGKYCFDNPVIDIVPPLNAVAMASCDTGAMPDIDLMVSGGTGPFTYNWSNGSTAEDLFNVAPGTYSVVVTDTSNGCTVNASATVGPTISTAINSITKISCFGAADGAADIQTIGGVAPFTYSWDNGATTEDLSGIGPGTYSLTITDALNCQAFAQVILNDPEEITTSALATDVGCFGEATGSIDLTVNGGTPGYTYLWSNGATTQDISGLLAGTY
ncbi:SprB repeat-containing protein, partial [Muriicola sp. Z0-33]|uniref:SprB repeat-containing protein n=1 Tax=Muriicola sp. Z0-33 TaxID=2816957 RepID=UPI0022390DED